MANFTHKEIFKHMYFTEAVQVDSCITHFTSPMIMLAFSEIGEMIF